MADRDPRQDLVLLLEELSPYLRDHLRSYGESVRYAAPAIARDMGVRLGDDELESFVFAAVVRKLWGLVSAQYWLLTQTLTVSTLAGKGIEFRVGRHRYGPDSPDTRELRNLFLDFERTIHQAELGSLVDANSLSELITNLRK